MNIPYDVLNLILSYTQYPECALVCSNWHKLIKQNGHICVKCNKITKMYDYDIWISDVYDKKCHMNLMLRIRILHFAMLTNTLNQLETLVDYCHMVFDNDKKMITIKEFTKDKEIIFMQFGESTFEFLMCKKNIIIISVNIKEFNAYLNCFKYDGNLHLSIYNDTKSAPKYLNISANNKILKYRLPNINYVDINIPDYEYDATCTMRIKDFISICKSFSENVNITCSVNKISFKSNNAKYTVPTQEEIDEKISIYNCNLQNLSSYNCVFDTHSNHNVNISLKKDHPLCVDYNLMKYMRVLMILQN